MPASRAAASSSSHGGATMMSEGRFPGPANRDWGKTLKIGNKYDVNTYEYYEFAAQNPQIEVSNIGINAEYQLFFNFLNQPSGY